jgi:hypothetical protein
MNNLSKVTLVTLIGCAILPVASPQPGASPKTFGESVYTAEQADRGAQIYSLAGATFHKNWDSQPLLVPATQIRAREFTTGLSGGSSSAISRRIVSESPFNKSFQ